MHFINIHTHARSSSVNMELVNVLKDFASIDATGFYSAGIHPWYIDVDSFEQCNELKSALYLQNVLAIGECGLDKVCKTSFDNQQEIFSFQIHLANEIQKPMIIHCVKAFDELFHQLKNENVQVPVIFHGFNKSKELALRIIKEGYYVSFGKHISDPNIREIFIHLPMEKLFFETDAADIHIESVYGEAALLKKISVEQLKDVVFENFTRCFSYQI